MKFVRDVAVNVLANLVAAAIIYLVGVIVGLFPDVADAVRVSVVILSVGSALVVIVSLRGVQANNRRVRRWSLYITLIGLLLVAVSVPITSWLIYPSGSIERILGPVIGVAMGVGGAAPIVAMIIDEKRRAERGSAP